MHEAIEGDLSGKSLNFFLGLIINPKMEKLDGSAYRSSLKLEAAAKAYDAAYAAKGATLDAGRRARLNAALLGIDQALLIPEGLPGRGWYKHALYAPGRFTGYGAKTLPGVREAVEERRFADANRYAGLTAAAVERLAVKLDTARGIIG